jgi:hypothetical protein
MACQHVFALHDAKEEWQGAPLLESCGKLARDSQREVWRKSIEVFKDGRSAPRTVALFVEDQTAPIDDEQVIQVRLKDLTLRRLPS